MHILGLSAFYHDSAAALLRDGEIVAASQEERFSRKKNDAKFPIESIRYCLREAGITMADVSTVVFYDKPLLKFDRLLETYLAYAPRGWKSFARSMPLWLKEKLFLKARLQDELLALLQTGDKKKLPKILFTEHHQSHAASAFFASPFQEAAVLCVDGVGEWTTTSAWVGHGNKLSPKWELRFPHSLGLLYSAFTFYAGFKVNSGEYKLMGLAPYGNPIYVEMIFKNLIDLKDDGTYRLNMNFFDYATGLQMVNRKFCNLFQGPPRQPEDPLTQKEMDLAASIQVVTEEVMLRLARTLRKETQQENLCLAGGVALNCVANGKILREGIFKNVWVQPAAGDAGGALGAALSAWHEYHGRPRRQTKTDLMQGSLLGPHFSESEIQKELERMGAVATRLSEEQVYTQTAKFLSEGRVVGWFQGRAEYGPRALGSRSILGDARNPKMQSVMNLKIKNRESFRPFAPAVLSCEAAKFFEIHQQSDYMSFVAKLKKEFHIAMTPAQEKLFGIEKLNLPRSQIPAVTHVDYSARLQTVDENSSPSFFRLISAFQKITGCPVIINTSFNVRGEPIVHSIENAYRCFQRTEMDDLMIGPFHLAKKDQPPAPSSLQEFELD